MDNSGSTQTHRRKNIKKTILILCVYSSQPTSVGKQLDRGTEVENPCVLTFTSVSRWRQWMERGARKVPRHQRGQYELRLPSKPKRPVTVRAPGRRHHWPHPGQEVLPPGLPQTPSPTHQQRRSGKKQQVVVAIISEQNENYSPPYDVAPIFQTATTFQKTNPVDPPSSSLLLSLPSSHHSLSARV